MLLVIDLTFIFELTDSLARRSEAEWVPSGPLRAFVKASTLSPFCILAVYIIGLSI